MGRTLRWIVLVTAGAAALLAGLHFGGISLPRFGPPPTPPVVAPTAAITAVPNDGSPASGATLMAVTLPDADGVDQSLGQWKGKVIVVNFWATWCAPCREEMPMFVRTQTEFGAKGLQFVGIAIDSADKVKQFAREINLNYPALIGGYGAMELSRTLGNRVMALPFTVIVDRSGNIVHSQLGELKSAQLNAIVSKLL